MTTKKATSAKNPSTQKAEATTQEAEAKNAEQGATDAKEGYQSPNAVVISHHEDLVDGKKVNYTVGSKIYLPDELLNKRLATSLVAPLSPDAE